MFFQPPAQSPAYNYNLPQQNFNLDGKPIPIYYVQNLKQIIDITNQLQQDPNLQGLITLLKNEQERSIEIIQKATSEETNKQKDPRSQKQQVQYVRERCSKIKKRNQQLLMRMLNLREKMVNQMYMYKTRSPKRELEISQINERIRDLKCQISLKYNNLRALKLGREQKEPQRRQQVYRSSINVPLVELKKGAQVLEKESLRLQKQFQLLQRFANGQLTF